MWKKPSARFKSYENERDQSAQEQGGEYPQHHRWALAHQPAWRLVLPPKIERLRFVVFGATAFTPAGSRRLSRFVGIVAEFVGHGNDASTEEKRAARNRPS
jgi:hypothetical protein